MKKVRALLAGLGVILLLVLAGFLAWVLPHHAVVHVDGHEVKRMDASGKPVDATHVATATRDVFFVYTSDPKNKDVRVFRNEDTGFGFPWYMKFDSAEVQGRAQMLSRDSTQLALVTYYGWRLPMFGAFPNAVDVQPWASEDGPFPVFNTIFFVVFAGVIGFGWWRVRSFRRRGAPR